MEPKRRDTPNQGLRRIATLMTCALALTLPLAACGGDETRSTTVSQTKTVSDVLDEQAQAADGSADASASTGGGADSSAPGSNDDASIAPTSDGSTPADSGSTAGSGPAAASGDAAEGTVASSSRGDAAAGTDASNTASADVDIDLTAMGADMVYATVYNMVTKPSNYTGKTVRMAGPIGHQYYDATKTTYHYVVIEDATACCAQGIEFVMGDGGQDESVYPTDGTRVTVTGTFEPYMEKGTQYVHLVESQLVLG